MLDASDTITHVFKELNKETRQYDWHSEVIDGCSWFREEKNAMEDKSFIVQDIIHVRIPLFNREKIPAIRLGDILIRGEADIRYLSAGKIRESYPDSFTVSSCTYNLKSTAYSRHIRCSGT